MNKFLALILAAVLTLSACGKKEENTATEQKPVIKIGIVYPMSGNMAMFGDAAKIAVKMFFEDHAPEKFKYHYKIIFEDSQGEGAKGVMRARKLIDYDKVDVIVDMISGVSTAISPIAETAKVAHVAFAQDEQISKGFYNWRVVTSTEKTGIRMLQELKKRGYSNVEAIVANASGPLSLFTGFEDIARSDDKVNIQEIHYINPGERDFKILWQKIKSHNPQVVVVSAHAPEIDVLMQQAKTNDVQIPIVGIQAFTFLRDKALANDSWYVDVAYAKTDFYERYAVESGTNITSFAENLYTVLQVITNNYETLKTKNGDKPSSEEFIKNMISAEGLETPIGKLEYNKKHQVIDSNASLRLIKNGEVINGDM